MSATAWHSPPIAPPVDLSVATASGAANRERPQWDGATNKIDWRAPMYYCPEDFRKTAGNGSTVSADLSATSVALQGAMSAAIADNRVLRLQPATRYAFDQGLVAHPGGQFQLDIAGGGTFDALAYYGPDNASILRAVGLKNSEIKNVRARLMNNQTGIVVFDWDIDAAALSSGNNDIFGLRASSPGTVTNCIGMRFGHDGAVPGTQTPGSEMSVWQIIGSGVAWGGTSQNNGSLGFLNEHANGLDFRFIGSSAAQCAKAFTNLAGAGSGADPAHGGSGSGGNSMYFLCFNGSFNTTAWEFVRAGGYGLSYCRMEDGGQLVAVPAGGTLGAYAIALTSVKASNNAPTGGKLIEMLAAGSLELVGCEFFSNTADYTAAMITLQTGATGFGSVNVLGGKYRASDPFYTKNGGTWDVNIMGARKTNASNQATERFRGADRTANASRKLLEANVTAPVLTVPASAGTLAPAATNPRWGRLVVDEDFTFTSMDFTITATAAGAGDTVCVSVHDTNGNELVSSGLVAGKLDTTGTKNVTNAGGAYTLRKGVVYYVAWSQSGGTGLATIETVLVPSNAWSQRHGAALGTMELGSSVNLHTTPRVLVAGASTQGPSVTLKP